MNDINFLPHETYRAILRSENERLGGNFVELVFKKVQNELGKNMKIFRSGAIDGSIADIYSDLDRDGIVYISDFVNRKRDEASMAGDESFIDGIFQKSGSLVVNNIRGVGDVDRMLVKIDMKDGIPGPSDLYPLWLSDTLNAIVHLTRLLERHLVTCNFLLSFPGCGRQPAHSDYDPAIFGSMPSNAIPLVCMVATEEGTSLVGYNTSGERMHWKIAPGDAVIFRADYVHAGSEYDKKNFRVHARMHPPEYLLDNENNFYLSHFDFKERNEFPRKCKK